MPGHTALVCAISDRGLERDSNEDVFIVVDLFSGTAVPSEDEARVHVSAQGLLLAVCDGMGGHANGALAAQIAKTTLVRELCSLGQFVEANPEGYLCQALNAANRRIYEESAREFGQVGMGTTCTAGLLMTDRLVLAQVGDSRAYLWRRNDILVQLTKDQSLIATMLESGELTPDQAAGFPGANIILQALGVREDVTPVASQVRTAPGDVILLASDGLHGQVSDSQIASILSTNSRPTDSARALVEASLEAGGGDNVTVVLALVE